MLCARGRVVELFAAAAAVRNPLAAEGGEFALAGYQHFARAEDACGDCGGGCRVDHAGDADGGVGCVTGEEVVVGEEKWGERSRHIGGRVGRRLGRDRVLDDHAVAAGVVCSGRDCWFCAAPLGDVERGGDISRVWCWGA